MPELGATGPIGVFDSGVGGLSIVRALWAELPAEDILYVADSANCPYGPRPRAEIERFCLGIARFLLNEGAKALVVACNTASAAALGSLRAAFPDTPVVGMVPAVKPAAAWTRSGVIGVLATPTTFDGALYQDVVRDHAGNAQVISATCPGLVELIEQGKTAAEETRRLLQTCLAPVLAAHADTLVLGCTHYPFVTELIRSVAGPGVRVFEPSAAVARQTRRVLTERALRSPTDLKGTTRFCSSGSAAELSERVELLLSLRAPAGAIRWRDDGSLQSWAPSPAESC